MTCTFPGFKTAILRSYEGVSYKYVVYSPTTKKPSDHFEYLHSYGDYDRCLKVPPEKFPLLFTGISCYLFIYWISDRAEICSFVHYFE